MWDAWNTPSWKCAAARFDVAPRDPYTCQGDRGQSNSSHTESKLCGGLRGSNIGKRHGERHGAQHLHTATQGPRDAFAHSVKGGSVRHLPCRNQTLSHATKHREAAAASASTEHIRRQTRAQRERTKSDARRTSTAASECKHAGRCGPGESHMRQHRRQNKCCSTPPLNKSKHTHAPHSTTTST
jgi:hypothetical protein